MKTLSEILAPIKNDVEEWDDSVIENWHVTPRAAKEEKKSDISTIRRLINEIEALQGILSDCQSESGAYQAGMEAGNKQILDALVQYADSYDEYDHDQSGANFALLQFVKEWKERNQ